MGPDLDGDTRPQTTAAFVSAVKVSIRRNAPSQLALTEATAVLDAARNRGGIPGLRDYAVLTLIHKVALKSDQVFGLDLADYSRRDARLTIRAPHTGATRSVAVESAAAALDAWLAVHPHTDQALFVSREGQRLSKRQIRALVKTYGHLAGLGAELHSEALRAPIPYDDEFLRDLISSAELPLDRRTVVDELVPFRSKSEVPYEVRLRGGHEERNPAHEKLVNAFASWLTNQGTSVGYGRQVDLGSLEPPWWIAEAEVPVDDTRASWALAVREAVGQLYEYRYFRRLPAETALIFLAPREVPSEWRRYLESDRRIHAVWQTATGFDGHSSALQSMGLPRPSRAAQQ